MVVQQTRKLKVGLAKNTDETAKNTDETAKKPRTTNMKNEL